MNQTFVHHSLKKKKGKKEKKERNKYEVYNF